MINTNHHLWRELSRLLREVVNLQQSELAQALESTTIPVAYREFKDTKKNPAPLPPFITYQFAYGSDFVADNQNYVDIENFQIELYTSKKDPGTEKLVQDKLKELRLPYSKVEFFLESEELIQVIYEVQLI